jgi:3-hydroxyisobutyrate dehydrogenase-like beta-hydroxyacid dehydrogenase
MKSLICLLSIFLFVCIPWSLAVPVVQASSSDHPNNAQPVTILGIGGMGGAVLQCLQKTNTVHAWNRGKEKLHSVVEQYPETVQVHDRASDAVRASDVTLIIIDDWSGILELIDSVNTMDAGAAWHNKTVVLFSTYSPTDIQKLVTASTQQHHHKVVVGGAIVGVPQTICTDQALILTSHANEGASIITNLLQPLGRVVAFTNDVGLAALANMALILVITFGIAGQELAQFIFRKYGVDEYFNQMFESIAAQVAPLYIKMLLPLVSKAITNREYEDSYVPVAVFRKVIQMHADFIGDLGIANDTFLASYLFYLKKVSEDSYLPAAWVEEASAGEEQFKDDEL